MSRFCQNCGNPLENNAPVCVKCGAKTMTTCANCGTANSAGVSICASCGAVLAGTQSTAPQTTVAASQPAAQPAPYALPQIPIQPAAPYKGIPEQHQVPQGPHFRPSAQPNYGSPAPMPPEKSKRGLLIGIIAGAVLVAAIVVILLMTRGGSRNTEASAAQSPSPAQSSLMSQSPLPSQGTLTPFPADLIVNPAKVNVACHYDAPDHIIPANYRSMDSIVSMKLSVDQGSADVLVSVEIPGFTLKYEQKVTVTRSVTELRIHPPLVDGAAQSLSSAKDAQIIVSVTNLNGNKIIVKDTKPIKLYSRYDMQWQDNDGTPYKENILAWVTPEAEEIKTLLRDSADSCNQLTGGKLDAIVGYQEAVSGWSHEEITYIQAFCIMHTLASQLGVRYIDSDFSSTDTSLQRIATPAEVIKSASGLCVETAVTVASALEAADMHAVLILLPGHCQLAVETWPGSGNYFLIETTALTAAASAKTQDDFNAVIWPHPITKDEWLKYISQDGYVAIDCDLGQQLHIESIS